jgi:hypothetical protein
LSCGIEYEKTVFGIGPQELIILLVVGLLTVVPGVLGLAVLIWLIVRSSRKPPMDE